MTSRLPTLPRIDVLQLAQVTAVPGYHPEHDTFRPFPVHAFVVHHPDGPIIVDTGIGFGNDLIDALYPHTSQRLLDGLHLLGLDDRQVQCVINSHLHVDHCGQNHVLSCPVVVQRAEIDAARQPEPEVTNLHDHTWAQAANDSLARLRALRPQRVLLSHDAPFEATQPQADTEHHAR